MINDIANMHEKFGVNEVVRNLDSEKLKSFLDFRLKFLDEELTETKEAFMSCDPSKAEEIVDGLIDLIVVAIGTLDAFDVDIQKAWDAVHSANMSKEVGIKEGRPNPLGLPDLVKPIGWQAPTHENNIGLFSKLF